jgi:hypothetical protein
MDWTLIANKNGDDDSAYDRLCYEYWYHTNEPRARASLWEMIKELKLVIDTSRVYYTDNRTSTI